MGWSLGFDDRWGRFGRDIGYGVPAACDHPGCGAEIDRGLSYVCGSEPYGGEHGCGLYFCSKHRSYEDRGDDTPQLCERCAEGQKAFEPTDDTAEWINHKLTDESWAVWRATNLDEVAALNGVATKPDDAREGSERSEEADRPQGGS